jgi:hypothetical protein
MYRQSVHHVNDHSVFAESLNLRNERDANGNGDIKHRHTDRKVTFKVGRVTLGSGILQGGNASYTTSPTQLSAGSHSLIAAYGGDASHAGSSSSVLVQTVNRAPTTTNVTSSPNPSPANQSVTLSATVTAPAGLPTPTGHVQFTSGGKLLGSAALSNGTATLNVTFTTSGSFTVKAAYPATGNYSGSSGTVVQVVQ